MRLKEEASKREKSLDRLSDLVLGTEKRVMRKIFNDSIRNTTEEYQMNNNIEPVELEEELFEHFKFEVPKGQAPFAELTNI
jgi:hypothetical protein